jgi:septal ring factor EnvC (AmiA/AmiB activator)
MVSVAIQGKVEEQEATITQLKSTMAEQEATAAKHESTIAQQQAEIKALAASLKEQASRIKKVSAQLAAGSPSRGGLEISKSTPKMADLNAGVTSLNR